VTAPDTACAFVLVRSRRESPVATFAVDPKRRWNAEPGRRLRLPLNPPSNGSQAVDLVVPTRNSRSSLPIRPRTRSA
jgi:hypothetical protein